jgi:hypothetical protein
MSALPPRWKELRPHPKQFALWSCVDKMVAVRAARRSGKTELAKRKLVSSLPVATWHGEPGRYLFLAPVRQQAKEIAWADLKAMVKPEWLDGEPKETELKIVTRWGSELCVGGFDKPMRFEGMPWDGVIVDESADIRPTAVDRSLIPALADRDGWLWRMGVPKRTGVGAVEFNEICDNPAKGYTYFSWSASEILPPEKIAELAEILDPKDFEEQILGKVVSSSGLAFHSFSRADGGNVINNLHTQYQPNRRIIVGSDFNVTPMVWVLCHSYNGCLYVFDEIWLKDTNTISTLNELHRRHSEHKNGWLFLGDATGRARKTAGTTATQSDYQIIQNDKRFMQGLGCEIVYPRKNPAVKDRLASTNAMLCNANGKRRLFVNPSCTHLIDDLGSRGVDKFGQPVDATAYSGHPTDALGYVVHGLYPIQTHTEYATENYQPSPIEFQLYSEE